MSKNISKEQTDLFYKSLEILFPETKPFLHGETDWQFLVAILLSAQMTDVGVNKATHSFFAVMKTPQDAINLGLDKIYEYIKTINFAPKKAGYILRSAELLVQKYNGIIPKTRKELIVLPGVGMKTAGVFLLNRGFEYAFPVDTHIRRIAQSFGFTESNNVDVIEQDLQSLFPKEQWLDLHLRMISYGRKYLPARNIPETVEDAWKDLAKNVADYSV